MDIFNQNQFQEIKPVKTPIIISSDKARKQFEDNLLKLQALEGDFQIQEQNLTKQNNGNSNT